MPFYPAHRKYTAKNGISFLYSSTSSIPNCQSTIHTDERGWAAPVAARAIHLEPGAIFFFDHRYALTFLQCIATEHMAIRIVPEHATGQAYEYELYGSYIGCQYKVLQRFAGRLRD